MGGVQRQGADVPADQVAGEFGEPVRGRFERGDAERGGDGVGEGGSGVQVGGAQPVGEGEGGSWTVRSPRRRAVSRSRAAEAVRRGGSRRVGAVSRSGVRCSPPWRMAVIVVAAGVGIVGAVRVATGVTANGIP